MTDDIEMEAPQISTLREEVTPPLQRTPEKKPKAHEIRTKSASEADVEEPEDPEEEEDQLMNDEDNDKNPMPSTSQASSRLGADRPQRRSTIAKRKSRKSDNGEKKAREKDKQVQSSRPGAFSVATTELSSKSQEDAVFIVASQSRSSSELLEPSLSNASSEKKTTPQKSTPIISRIKIKMPKLKATESLLPADDPGTLSEAGSSPVNAHFEAVSPDPEVVESDIKDTILLPATGEASNILIPTYPLPSKPFPVQNAPKIPTGFAPTLFLDKSGKKVRHWRTAKREIRGIAGGRWFSQAWVGDRVSEFAAAVVSSVSKNGDSLSSQKHLSSLSVPLPSKLKSKGSKGASSLTASAAPSRSGSAIPESFMASAVRAQTKMRILQFGPAMSEGGDSDMAAPSDS